MANDAEELSPEEQAAISEEETLLAQVLTSLRDQADRKGLRLASERARARELTSELVAASRDEDKAMLASDEAVSHALRDKHSEEAENLEKLIQKPYFARFVLEEADERNGASKKLEYRLGYSANPDCRIVDWRKAPISRIFYEYREGDEYAEEIQGREREGKLTLRNSLEIERGELRSLSCRHGTFRRAGGQWERSGGRRRAASASGLKNILPLITPDQFRTITEEANTAVLIQGIAGSGKTTVALHRLAWLLHEDNSDLRAERCGVVVLSKVLKAYINNTLPSMEVHGVPIFTFREWLRKVIEQHAKTLLTADGELPLSREPKNLRVRLLRGQLSLLRLFEQEVREKKPPISDYWEVLRAATDSEPTREAIKKLGFAEDSFELLRAETAKGAESKMLSDDDLPYLARMLQIRNEETRSTPLFFDHLVVDEVQDYSGVDLAVLVGTVKKPEHLTLVGDSAQAIDQSKPFVGWEELQSEWSFHEESTRYFSLSVSHRSTLPIMRFADHIRGEKQVTTGREGRRPIWFSCRNESQGVQAGLKWLSTAVEKYPNALTAVIVRRPEEARYVFSLLTPSFGPLVRLGSGAAFTFEEGIVVSCVRDVKGLEFTNVLIWNPSNRSYPKTPTERNALYVAATRAEENLCLVSWERQSRWLPPFYSKIVRGIDLADPDLEASQERAR